MSDFPSPRILIVEDEWLVRMELADAFDELGCAVIESASAERGIEILRADATIALLVTDIRLTGEMDGWDLAIAARKLSPGLPVLYLSANPPEDALIVPGGVFIDKPALMSRVIEAAHELLGERRPG